MKQFCVKTDRATGTNDDQIAAQNTKRPLSPLAKIKHRFLFPQNRYTRPTPQLESSTWNLQAQRMKRPMHVALRTRDVPGVRRQSLDSTSR